MLRSNNQEKSFSLGRVLLLIGGILGVAYIFFIVWMGVTYFQAQSWSKFVECEELADETETTRVIQQHADLVGKIGQSGGDVQVVSRPDCSNKAEILIYYSVHREGRDIRELGGYHIGGLPYRLINL